jgi:hypothetical protein
VQRNVFADVEAKASVESIVVHHVGQASAYVIESQKSALSNIVCHLAHKFKLDHLEWVSQGSRKKERRNCDKPRIKVSKPPSCLIRNVGAQADWDHCMNT